MVKMKKLPVCPLRRAKTEKADSDKDSTKDANITGAIEGESNIQPVVGPAEQPSQPKGESNITGGNVTIVTTPNSPSAKEESPQGTKKKRAGVRLVRVRTYSPPIQIINVSSRQERRFQEKDIAKATLLFRDEVFMAPSYFEFDEYNRIIITYCAQKEYRCVPSLSH